jgi:hypothetical protein
MRDGCEVSGRRLRCLPSEVRLAVARTCARTRSGLLAGWAGFVCGGRGGKIRGHCAFSDASGWFRRTLPMAMITAIMFLLSFCEKQSSAQGGCARVVTRCWPQGRTRPWRESPSEHACLGHILLRCSFPLITHSWRERQRSVLADWRRVTAVRRAASAAALKVPPKAPADVPEQPGK